MTDKEKIKVLETENALLKEQIELLEKLNTQTKIEYIPYPVRVPIKPHYPYYTSLTGDSPLVDNIKITC